MFVLAILAGALSSASAATLVAAITPFNIRSVVSTPRRKPYQIPGDEGRLTKINAL